MADGTFAAEIVPIGGADRDEHPRADTTLESLAALRPIISPPCCASSSAAMAITPSRRCASVAANA